MSATLVVGCSLLGVVVGWSLDPVITRVPRRVPVLGPPVSDEPPSSRARRIVVTVACAGLFGATAARFDGSWALPAYLVLAAGLVALSAVDLEHYLLPNRIVYPLTVAVVGLLALASLGEGDLGAFGRAMAAGVVAFGAFFVLHLVSPRSLGFGDVKLSFALGVALGWLGWGELFLGLFLAFVYGAVVGVVLIASGRRGRKQHVPFGPFMAAGALTAVLLGDALISWYVGS